ncbi:Metabotropic glutamate receptor 5 [Zootermopsis nevadensis]|uniref:Metabotropic glutamate receptor 5 n=2 Tax=Zootermopsis nevadensis TaxID=136037 RepID=A0A067QVB0_ZOONE|nr:Metabotropic glutamate receptor 5 [Zootermopsis nevadensis]
MDSHLALFLVLLVTAFSSQVGSKAYDKASVGVLIDLHVPGSEDMTSPQPHCGALNLPAVQYILAARWAAEVINNQSVSQGIKIGIELFDTCGLREIAMRDVFFAVKNALEPRGKLPLLGLIGMGDPDVVGETVTTLHAFNIPLILASPRLADSVTQEGNILTTAPDMSGVVKPLLTVGKELGITSINLISSCSHSIKKFGQIATEMGILVGRILQITKHSNVIGDIVKKFLEELEPNEAIALILDPEEIYALAQHLRSYELHNSVLLTGTIGLDKNLLKLWKNIFTGGYLIEPHMPELPDFRNYFLYKLQTASTNDDTLVHEYMEMMYDCKWGWKNDSQNFAKDCGTLQESELSRKLEVAPEVTFVVKAVSAFSAAVFLVQVEKCQGRNLSECLRTTNINLQQEILSVLSQLSFTSQHKAPFELQGTSIHVTHDGQLISNKYVIFHIRDTGDVSGIGWYSDDQGLVLDHNAGSVMLHFLNGRRKVSSSEKQGRGYEADAFPKMKEVFEKDGILASLQDAAVKGIQVPAVGRNVKFAGEDGSGVNVIRVTPESSITRPWATVMVAVAAVGTCITMFMLVYVLIKICDGTLAGNQSLGIVLLLGIMTLYVSIVLFVLPASEMRCILRAFLHPIAMSLCYGILIIKLMQLRSLVLLGLGGRISYINQYIILFFIVLVQVVINVQWFLANRPQFRVDSEGIAYCFMPRTDFLLLHLYVTILVIIAFLYGLSVLKIRRNYKEGHWVTLAAFLTMPVLVVWGIVCSFVPEKYNDPTVCVALVVLATVLVLALFIPKMSTISKQSSHFKHKKMHMSDSVTTVFTTFTNLHNSSTSGSRKKGARTPHRQQHFNAGMLDAYADNITKNPIYEVTNGAYP